MRVIAVAATIGWCATAAWAESAGPPRPIAPKRTPAEQAADLYRDEYASATRNVSCAPARAGEVVVCGGARSPYRIPLPDEREPPDHPRIATGEPPRAFAGGPPVPTMRGVGLTLAVSIGRGAAPAAVSGLGDARDKALAAQDR